MAKPALSPFALLKKNKTPQLYGSPPKRPQTSRCSPRPEGHQQQTLGQRPGGTQLCCDRPLGLPGAADGRRWPLGAEAWSLLRFFFFFINVFLFFNVLFCVCVFFFLLCVIMLAMGLLLCWLYYYYGFKGLYYLFSWLTVFVFGLLFFAVVGEKCFLWD